MQWLPDIDRSQRICWPHLEPHPAASAPAPAHYPHGSTPTPPQGLLHPWGLERRHRKEEGVLPSCLALHLLILTLVNRASRARVTPGRGNAISSLLLTSTPHSFSQPRQLHHFRGLNSSAGDARADQLLLETTFVSVPGTHSARDGSPSPSALFTPQRRQRASHQMAGPMNFCNLRENDYSPALLAHPMVSWREMTPDVREGAEGRTDYSFTTEWLCGLGQVLNLFESNIFSSIKWDGSTSRAWLELSQSSYPIVKQ